MKHLLLILLGLVALTGACTKKKKNAEEASQEAKQETLLTSQQAVVPLPEGLEWVTNLDDPIFASPEAKRGGTLRLWILSFPMTLRTVGPDSNSAFAGVMRNVNMWLTSIHPNTRNIIPSLATHWAYGSDGKTVYYKLDQRAKWSDGKPVTADDYLFTLEFMRSEHIVAPWYNNHYTEEMKEVRKHDDHTISITGASALPRWELHYMYGLAPTPRHFHKLDEKWVNDYNWKVEPNTGPYDIDQVNKGKSIVLKRKPQWWGDEVKYFQHRFNVERINYTVVRDFNMAWEMFKKGDLDTFALTLPEYWHDKAKGEIFDKGYVHKGWFYNDAPQPDFGIWLNQDVEIFKDRNVRYAFAHGMNIDKVLKEVLRGDYLRLHTGTYGHGEYTNHSIRAREFSIPKVEALMTQSGWKRGSDGIWAKDGKRFSVRVTYGRPDHSDRLVVVQEEAKKAGIELNLQLLDSNASFKTMQEKNHEVAWSAWSPQPLPEYRSLYHSSNAHKPQNNNFSNTDNKDIDAAIEGFIRGTTVEEKAKFAHRLQELVHEEGAYIPTFLAPYFREAYWRWWRLPTPPSTRLSSALIEPLDSSSGGLFWFDEALHKETMEARKSGKAFAPVTIIDETFRPDPKKEAR